MQGDQTPATVSSAAVGNSPTLNGLHLQDAASKFCFDSDSCCLQTPLVHTYTCMYTVQVDYLGVTIACPLG